MLLKVEIETKGKQTFTFCIFPVYPFYVRGLFGFSLCFVMRRSLFRFAQRSSNRDGKNSNTAMILGAVVVGTVGLSYAAVPLYRMFCSGFPPSFRFFPFEI